MTYAYIGLGGNVGRPQRQLRRGVRFLRRVPAARVTAVSPFYGSAPVGCPGRQRQYCNAVVEMQTRLPPARLFRWLRRAEKSVQRKRRAGNAPRRLDVDYLAHGAARQRRRFLTLPHPAMFRRAFVARPLHDILRARRPASPLLARARAALPRCRGQALYRL